MTMLKAKIFTGKTLEELENNINDFFIQNDSSKLVLLRADIFKDSSEWVVFTFLVEYSASYEEEPFLKVKKEEDFITADSFFRAKTNDDGMPATTKQIYALEKAGIPCPKGLTKRQAMQMIKELRESKA